MVDSFAKHAAGSSTVNFSWNAAELSSGVYVVQLVVNNVPTHSRKVVLLK